MLEFVLHMRLGVFSLPWLSVMVSVVWYVLLIACVNDTIFCLAGALACCSKKLMTGLMFAIRLIGCIIKLTSQFRQTGLVWQKPLDW